jgi:hypothetical protein
MARHLNLEPIPSSCLRITNVSRRVALPHMRVMVDVSAQRLISVNY